MSMFVSSFLPNGNYLLAADTRVSQTRSDGFLVPLRDDFHKIVQLSKNTFIFMSGASSVCQLVVDTLKRGFKDETTNDRLIEIGNSVMARIDKTSSGYREYSETSNQVMAFFLIQITCGKVHAYLYLSSCKFEPLEYNNLQNECVVLGAFIPGCDNGIRACVGDAKTYSDTIPAYRNMFNSQSRAEVGGNLEMYELSPTSGLVKTMKYKILESNYMDCLPPLSKDGHLTWGANNVPNKQRWAASSTGPWHSAMQSGDIWCCDWNYATESWGVPYKKVGQDGRPGQDGMDGRDGSDAEVDFYNIKRALQRANGLQNTFITADEMGSPNIYGGNIYGTNIYAGQGASTFARMSESGLRIYKDDVSRPKITIGVDTYGTTPQIELGSGDGSGMNTFNIFKNSYTGVVLHTASSGAQSGFEFRNGEITPIGTLKTTAYFQ